jgi:hypothetical protein
VENSQTVKERVEAAAALQRQRYFKTSFQDNASLDSQSGFTVLRY